MAEAINRTRDGDLIVEEVAATATTTGEVRQLQDGRVGVATRGVAAGAIASYAITGKHEVCKDSAIDFSAGEESFWDVSENELTNQANADEAGVDFFVGFVETATVASDPTADVLLREGVGGAAFVIDATDLAEALTLVNALKDIAIKNGDMDPS